MRESSAYTNTRLSIDDEVEIRKLESEGENETGRKGKAKKLDEKGLN